MSTSCPVSGSDIVMKSCGSQCSTVSVDEALTCLPATSWYEQVMVCMPSENTLLEGRLVQSTIFSVFST